MQQKCAAAQITYCALFAALTAILSQISIPLEPVPLNLATLSVFLAGGLLGPIYGGMSMAVYAVLGAVGAPVFAGFTGGVGILIGPTGGYIIGYIAAAWLTGLLSVRWGRSPLKLAVGMAAGLFLCYLLGTLWYMVSMGSPLLPAMMACVLPFLPGDAAKIALAVVVVSALKKRMTW